MRAGVVHHTGGLPHWEDFPEPSPQPGQVLIEVSTAAIGPSELMRVSDWGASYYGPFKGPKVMGGEGVGRVLSGPRAGERVYFGHAAEPYGAVAERTVVPDTEVWAIPESLTDAQVLPLAISGTGALIPLEEARIQPGERVLVLGATGPLGQIALQLARLLGAGEVVAAARREAPLQALVARGWADRYACLGQADDAATLKAASNGGFHVVLDCVYGDAMVAALKATARGGRVMSISNVGGQLAAVELKDLIFRTHAGVATGIRPVAERHAAFERLLAHARSGQLQPVDTLAFRFDQITDAWQAQGRSPSGKVLLHP